MIERLVLKKFGRFENRTFLFGDSVVFYGPNESGKTTIFDALFTTLCRVPKQGTHKNEIYLRYAERMEAEIVPEDLRESFDLGEFKDLYSIRSGDVALSFGEDSSWADTVKAALFSGGIDPAAIAAELESDGSDKTTLKHNKEIAQRRESLKKLGTVRDELEAERERHAQQSMKSDELKERLASNAAAIRDCETEMAALEADLALEESIRRRNELDDAYRLLAREEKLRETLDALPVARGDLITHLDALDAAIVRLNADRDAMTADLARRTREQRGKESERDEVEKRSAEGIAVARRADVLIARINEFLGAARRMKVVTSWNIPLAVASVLLAAGAIVAGLLMHPLFFIGIIAGAGLLLARRSATVEDVSAVTQLQSDVRDEFRTASGISLRSEGLQGMAEELRAFVAAHDRLAEDLKRLAGDIEQARTAVREAEKSREVLDERIRAQEASRALLLRESGGAGRDELAGRSAKRKSTEEQLAVASAEVRSRMLAARATDQAVYADDIRRQLADAERDGIPRTGRSPAEVQQLNKRLAALREKRRSLEVEQTNTKEVRAFADGTTRSLGGVLEKLLATEQEIGRINEEITGLELNKKGAALAAAVFRTMASDSGTMLAQLAAEMQQTFEGLLAVPRTIEVGRFSSDTIQAVDAGGTMRGIGHLSRGTRDTLTFAARLTLAMKADPAGEKRLLVLDEPFTSLDPERTTGALRLVRRIQDDRGWQVVLFTKDPGLARQAEAVLKEPVRHDL